MFKYVLIYFAIVNIIGMMLNIVDKNRAVNNKWRIPEKTLWLFAIIGGAPLSYITMKIIRHKTKHKSFMIGFLLLSIIQIALLIYLFSTTGGN